MGQFQDQIVVITGGVGNVGKATATAFADQGATVVLLDYNEDGLKAALEVLIQTTKTALQ
jgi:NAD(P)-dependent dehydrogenase (short-subunit alcohol dehydrogenase family)